MVFNKKKKQKRGVIVVLVLIFGMIFLILFGGLLGFIVLQYRNSLEKWAWAESLHIAEAGANLYKWCQNHELECPAEKVFSDISGNEIGEFSLEFSSTISCGEITDREVVAIGWTADSPDIQRKIRIDYGRLSVGRYAYLLNDNVWAGEDREISGLYHSNGGIRMDGENQSLVSSARDTWLCTSSFGCDYLNCPDDCSREGDACRCPGVFTTTQNSNPDLFLSPVPPFDFEGITMEFAEIRNLVFSYPQEKYWPPSEQIDAGAKGYHLKFFNDGTFEVWIITDLEATYSYSLEEDWHYDYFIIENEYLYDSLLIESDCPLLFFEDNLWVEGEVKGKVTVVSADLLTPTRDTSMVLSGEINYTSLDGSDGLALAAQENILIPPDSPNQMELRGIFVAQKGRFGRNHYPSNIREKLEIYGSIVSNGRVGTKWISGSVVVSGYLKRENYIDSHLIYNPPAFTPYVSSDFEIINWEEVE
jgi:hypothetical protein